MNTTATKQTIHPDSPVTPDQLSPAELERLTLARSTHVIILDQLPDGKFNIYGNAVVVCPECDNLFIGATGTISTRKQAHLSIDHGISCPMLP